MSTEDERSIANKLERESKRDNEPEKESEEAHLSKKDPTLPVSCLLQLLISLSNTNPRPQDTATSQARAPRLTRRSRRRRPRS